MPKELAKIPDRPDELSIDYFRWLVPSNGYEWQRLYRVKPGGGRPARALDTALVVRPGKWTKRYQPLEDHPDLFLEFADLDIRGSSAHVERLNQAKAAIQRFAGLYGELGTMEEFFRSRIIKPVDRMARSNLPEIMSDFGDSWWTWANNIQLMRMAVSVWELTGAAKPGGQPDRAKLRERIVWEQIGHVTRVKILHPDERGVTPIGSSDDPRTSELLKGWRVGELVRPARAFVANQINKGVRGRTSPQFVYRGNEWQPATVPRNLLGCLWYQFFRAFTGEARIRRCSAPGCGKWMLYERDSKTMHKACANRLRQRRFRQQKENENDRHD